MTDYQVHMKMKDVRLTTNFMLHEVLVGNLDAELTDEQMRNVYALVNRIQCLRDVLNKPITFNSFFRTVQHNAEVGGAKNSYHLKGMAADIVVKDTHPEGLQHMLRDWSGGLGSYKTFTHIDIGPKRRW